MGVPILGQTPGDGNSPLMETKQLDSSGPFIRLLYCMNCKSFDEIPDFEGHPDDDVLLQIIVDQHQSTGVPHAGHLFKVPLRLWAREDVRTEIMKQIRGGASPGLDAFMPDYYNVRNQFAADAMTCYGQHNRPAGQCPDFASEKKRLRPDTKAERKDLGLSPTHDSGPKVYLCDFCPVKTYNMTKAREQKGMYK